MLGVRRDVSVGGGRGHLGGKEKERESIDWVKGEDDSVEKEKTYKGNIY